MVTEPAVPPADVAACPAPSRWISLPPYSTEPGSGPSPGAISATVSGSIGGRCEWVIRSSPHVGARDLPRRAGPGNASRRKSAVRKRGGGPTRGTQPGIWGQERPGRVPALGGPLEDGYSWCLDRSRTIDTMGFDPDLVPFMTGRRALVGWMVTAFLVTFLATRAVTQAIRRGRGPFRDTSVGGVHVHHEVYGIFLLLGTGTAEFTYRPGPPWVQLLATLFGVGAALTLDEFALWLRLDDVYWSRQGRSSVDAVLVALVVGCLLLVGANPLDSDDAAGEGVVALTVVAQPGVRARRDPQGPRSCSG